MTFSSEEFRLLNIDLIMTEISENSPFSKRQVPVVAIRGSVVFPHTDAVLSFGRKKSVAAVNAAFQADRLIAVFAQKDTRTSDPGYDDLYSIGTLCSITQMMSTEGEIHAVIRGQSRVRLNELTSNDPYLVGKIE